MRQSFKCDSFALTLFLINLVSTECSKKLYTAANLVAVCQRVARHFQMYHKRKLAYTQVKVELHETTVYEKPNFVVSEMKSRINVRHFGLIVTY